MTVWPLSLYPSSHYYPILSDMDMKYPYRVRNPMSLNYPLSYYSRGLLPSRRSSPWYSTPSLPSLFRDPWWLDYPLSRGYGYPRWPYYTRTSYLSPIKRVYVWSSHPKRRGNRW